MSDGVCKCRCVCVFAHSCGRVACLTTKIAGCDGQGCAMDLYSKFRVMYTNHHDNFVCIYDKKNIRNAVIFGSM